EESPNGRAPCVAHTDRQVGGSELATIGLGRRSRRHDLGCAELAALSRWASARTGRWRRKKPLSTADSDADDHIAAAVAAARRAALPRPSANARANLGQR